MAKRTERILPWLWQTQLAGWLANWLASYLSICKHRSHDVNWYTVTTKPHFPSAFRFKLINLMNFWWPFKIEQYCRTTLKIQCFAYEITTFTTLTFTIFHLKYSSIGISAALRKLSPMTFVSLVFGLHQVYHWIKKIYVYMWNIGQKYMKNRKHFKIVNSKFISLYMYYLSRIDCIPQMEHLVYIHTCDAACACINCECVRWYAFCPLNT